MRTTIVAAEGRVADQDRTAQLYRQHATAGIRLAYLLTGDQAPAEDLFHDAFIRAAAKIGAMRDPAAFGGYLRRAIVNQHTSGLRRKKLERAHIEREKRMPVTARSGTSVIEDRDELWAALLELPPRQRAVIVLRYYEDQSEAATANAIGCSVAAVKSMTRRAMEALRQKIGDDDA